MRLTIDTSEPISDLDRAVIRGLLGSDHGSTITPIEAVPAPKAAAPAPVKAAPAPAVKAAPAPAPEPEEDVLGTEEPTIDDAVKLATTLVANGESARVKEVLNTLGARRVSELKGKNIAAFLSELG